MKIRPMAPQDLDAVAAIQATAPEGASWRPEEYLGYDAWVAEEDGVVGFAVVREVSPGESEVLNVAVDPRRRRKGVGRALLRHLVREGEWFLEVRTSNVAAITLYLSEGFIVAGRRKQYYQNPDEDAIVLVRRS
jgi:ribosomal-protein-alanine N-acetyltransferase